MKKFGAVVLSSIPMLVLIGLIPLVRNDYILAGIFLLIIIVAMKVQYSKFDLLTFAVGFFGMGAAEYLFIMTGVETFERQTLLGVMPLWLPLLWGYGLVAMKHIGRILER